MKSMEILKSNEDIQSEKEDHKNSLIAIGAITCLLWAFLAVAGMYYLNGDGAGEVSINWVGKTYLQVVICTFLSGVIVMPFLAIALSVLTKNGIDTGWLPVTQVQQEEIEKVLDETQNDELRAAIKGLDRSLVQSEYDSIMLTKPTK